MNKKSIIPIIIIIIILAGLILGIPFIKNNHNSNKPNNNKPKDISNIANQYPKYLRNFDICSSGYEFNFENKTSLEFEDLDAKIINNILYNYLDENKLVTYENHNNQQNENSEGTKFYGDAVLSDTNYRIQKFKKEDLIKAFKTLFGNKDNYTFNDKIEINGFEYILNNDEYSAKINKSYFCINDIYPSFYVYNIGAINDIFKIEVALYYTKYDYQKEPIEIILNKKDSNEGICQKDKISENLNMFTKYSINFKQKDGQYLFDRILPIK